MQSGLFYLIYRQRYLRRWSPEMFAGRVVTLAALPAGNGDETESEGYKPQSAITYHFSYAMSFIASKIFPFSVYNSTPIQWENIFYLSHK